jgi:hypothetical protein
LPPLRVHVFPFEHLRVDRGRQRVPAFVEPFASVLPWLGAPSAYQRSVAGEWVDAVPNVVVSASLGSADIAVLPFDLEVCGDELYARARYLATQALAEGKVMLVFCQGDVEYPAPGPNCVVLRTSSSRRSLGPSDVVMPAWIADPATKIPLDVRPWGTTPTVNFVGHAYPLGMDHGGPGRAAVKWLKAGLRAFATSAGMDAHLGWPPAHLHRVAAVAALRSARGLDAQVVLRQAMTRLDQGPSEADALLLDYLRRILASDYTLAVRGAGNYSYRLYESLAVGRPAVSVRTGDVRPCVNDVPWEAITIDVPLRRLSGLGPAVRRGHLIHQHDWPELQTLCRQSWVDWLSAPAYFRRLADRVSGLADRGSLTPEAIATALA